MNATKVWDKQSIHDLLDKKDVAVLRGIVTIYAAQTADEQAGALTKHTNGVGFNKFDAEFMSSLARQINQRGTLSPKQLAIGRNKLKHYWRQLADKANGMPQMGRVSPVECVPVIESNVEASACTCEHYDGERLCPTCTAKVVHGTYNEQEGTWS